MKTAKQKYMTMLGEAIRYNKAAMRMKNDAMKNL